MQFCFLPFCIVLYCGICDVIFSIISGTRRLMTHDWSLWLRSMRMATSVTVFSFLVFFNFSWFESPLSLAFPPYF